MSNDRGCTFWDAEVACPTHTQWMAVPLVRRYLNERLSGDADTWPLDWFQRTYPGTRFARALSIGCGSGALERDLVSRGICESIDAFDGSIASLAIARAEGNRKIRYFAADFNRPALPARFYDAVFIHQALHHVAKLERLLREVLRALKPGGMLYLDEYIGPSRTYWNETTVQRYAELYEQLPVAMRYHVNYFPGPIQEDDPSEAIRSAEIIDQLRIGFETEQLRGYGGNVLAVLFPNLRTELVDQKTVAQIIEWEKQVLGAGERDFHAVIVARPKRGFAAAIASARYFAEPKIKRMLRALSFR